MHNLEKTVHRAENTVKPAAETSHQDGRDYPSSAAPEYGVTTGNEDIAGPCNDCYQNIKDTIKAQVDDWGTDEDAIFQSIRQCPQRGQLFGDMHALQDLRSEMGGHDLWRAYLLITYGTEANFPQTIQDIWDATKGMGTDEEKIFTALRSMDNETRNTFGLGYILQQEMGGADLAKAMGIINGRDYNGDSVKGNLFGDPSAAEGEEQFIINPENAVELIGAEFMGAGSDTLIEAMNVLYTEPEGEELNQAIGTVAALRGLDPDKAMEQYLKAKRLRKQGRDYYRAKKIESTGEYDERTDDPSPDLSGDNADFTATNAQLIFGKIIGDVFSIDPVFGSLMSPTGGMAGGGNDRIDEVKNGSAVATHGAVHDAGGYLKNCFNIGPGYDYFQIEAGSDTTHHLAGQTTIRWWIEQYEAKGIDRGMIDGTIENLLANTAHIGAAFSKDFLNGGLTMPQLKEILETICSTPAFLLEKAGIDENMRFNEVEEMFDNLSPDEQKELAKYYFDNGGFRNRFLRNKEIYNFLDQFR
jgi:hypothetical protein